MTLANDVKNLEETNWTYKCGIILRWPDS